MREVISIHVGQAGAQIGSFRDFYFRVYIVQYLKGLFIEFNEKMFREFMLGAVLF